MNIKDDFQKIKEYFSPKVIGEVNDSYIKIAKIKGDELPWHVHKNEDEFFYILEGKLFMEVEHKKGFLMQTGDYHLVKKGMKHRISSKEECKIMLIEHKDTAHTGEVKSKITRSIKDQLQGIS